MYKAPNRGYQNHVRLFNAEKLDVEDQGAVTGNAWLRLAAVGKMGRNRKSSFSTNCHALDTNVPPLDNFTQPYLEGKGLSLLVCYMANQS